MGSELEPKQKTGKEPGSKKKVMEDESARPEKPKRGRKQQHENSMQCLRTCSTYVLVYALHTQARMCCVLTYMSLSLC